MRLRWITVLWALALKLALIGAMLLLGRMVLEQNYATLEREHIEADLAHLCRSKVFASNTCCFSLTSRNKRTSRARKTLDEMLVSA